MGDNSLDWEKVLGALSDSDELMSMIINDSKADPQQHEKPRDDPQHQESSKILLQLAEPPYQNGNVTRDVEPRSSSCQTQNLQTRMITTRGCLVNPLGFPYRSPKQRPVEPAAASSGNGTQSSQELLMPRDIPIKKRGRKDLGEAIGAVERKKMMTKIKNRISAAKSRAKRQEHTKSLEEEVEQLKYENAHLKKLLSMEDEARDRLPVEEEEETEG